MKKISLLIILLMVLGACKKKGCIDRLAKNYDSSAKKESTCYYEGRVILWKDTQEENYFEHDVLDYYFDGQLLHTDSLLEESILEPDCENGKGKKFTLDMGTETNKAVYYKIVHRRSGVAICDSSVLLRAGYCVPHKLKL